MAKKKITVLGDTADESLTPEQEHALEEKIDAMLDPARPDKQIEATAQVAAKQEDTNEKPPEKILVLDSAADVQPEHIDAAAESVAQSAPPLPAKPHKKVSITIRHHDEPADTVEVAQDAAGVAEEEPAASPLPDIPGLEEAEAVPAAQEPADAPEDTAEPSTEPAAGEEVTGEQEPPEEQPADQEPVQAPEPPVKKYRPPDGPLPFKRAQPEPEIAEDKAAPAAGSQLAKEDAAINEVFNAKPADHKPAKKHRRRGTGWIVLLVIIIIVAAICAVPKTRAMLLNAAHVKGTLTVTVMDTAIHGPLSGVNVQVGTLAATTNSEGKATISGLKLGSQSVTLEKTAFAPVTKSVFLGWKTGAESTVSMQLTGTEYILKVVDGLSGLPVSGAQATSGSSAAQGNDSGGVALAIAKGTAGTPVTVAAEGYKDAKVQLPQSPSQPVAVKLTPTGSDVFVEREAGTYNVYKVDLDGQNKQLLLAGTGRETSHMNLVVSPDGRYAALVSTRDNQRDKAGYLLDTLTLIDVRTGKTESIDHAQDIQVVGCSGFQVVYTALQPDVAATSASRYELYSYSTKTQKRTEITHVNDFNDVVMSRGVIYYATAGQQGGASTGVFAIRPDGSQKRQLLAADVTNIFHTGYDQFLFATGKQWYAYKVGEVPGDTKPTPTNSTYSGTERLYVEDGNGTKSAYVDGAKGQLLLDSMVSSGTDTEKMLTQQAGLTYPVHWLGQTTLVYRVSTSSGAADYVVSTLGGTPQKVTAVTDVNGLTLWNN